MKMYSFASSPLSIAIRENSHTTPAKTLTILNALETDVGMCSLKEETYLHSIAHAYKTDDDAPNLLPVVFQLSNAGIDACAVDYAGNTALHIAAKGRYSRRLLRALLMIGVDPTIVNSENKSAAQLASLDVDNSKVLTHFYPGLWMAVTHSDHDFVNKLLRSWCKVDYSRDGEHLVEHAEENGDDQINEALRHHAKTVSYVHYALAGDRQRMRSFLQQPDFNQNTVTDTYIDVTMGNFVSMPLIGEVALLGLTSVVRKMVRKKCDVSAVINGKPLALYVLENMAGNDKMFIEMYHVFIDKVDLKQHKLHTTEFLDAAYEKKLPLTVLSTMAANGLDLFATDDDGRFLRDRIFLKNASEKQVRITWELKYVDDIVVLLAERGCTRYLQRLAESFYQHIDVVSRDGVHTVDALTTSVGADSANDLLLYIKAVQNRFIELLGIIKADDNERFKKRVHGTMLNVTDPLGRTIVHHIAMHGRELMLGYYIQRFRPKINVRDKAGRTPLFYVCLLEGSLDIEELLTQLGCNMDEQDMTGVSPADVKTFSQKKTISMLEQEKSRWIPT